MLQTLRALREGEFRAGPGLFRAVVLIDSEPYQIGEDAGSIEQAWAMIHACSAASGQAPVTIIDDAGENQILVSGSNTEVRP